MLFCRNKHFNNEILRHGQKYKDKLLYAKRFYQTLDYFHLVE